MEKDLSIRFGMVSFLMFLWLVACSSPRSGPAIEAPTAAPTLPDTRAPGPTAAATVAASIQPTITQVPSPEGAREAGESLELGVSYIGGIEADRAWYHVSLRGEFLGFTALSIEVIDAVSGRTLAGPFAMTETESELCRVLLYETEAIDMSELPEDWWYQQTIEPYYIYRLTLRDQEGRDQNVDVYDIPGVCTSEAA